MTGARLVAAVPNANVEPPEGTLCVCCDAPVSRSEGAGVFASAAAGTMLWVCRQCQPGAQRLLVAASEAGWLRRAESPV
jgi:hypothetical protein